MLNSPNTLPSLAKMLIIGFLANQRMCKDICPCRDSPYIDEILSVKSEKRCRGGTIPSRAASPRHALPILWMSPRHSLDTDDIISEENRQIGKYMCNHRDMIKTKLTAL